MSTPSDDFEALEHAVLGTPATPSELLELHTLAYELAGNTAATAHQTCITAVSDEGVIIGALIFESAYIVTAPDKPTVKFGVLTPNLDDELFTAHYNQDGQITEPSITIDQIEIIENIFSIAETNAEDIAIPAIISEMRKVIAHTTNNELDEATAEELTASGKKSLINSLVTTVTRSSISPTTFIREFTPLSNEAETLTIQARETKYKSATTLPDLAPQISLCVTYEDHANSRVYNYTLYTDGTPQLETASLHEEGGVDDEDVESMEAEYEQFEQAGLFTPRQLDVALLTEKVFASLLAQQQTGALDKELDDILEGDDPTKG
jgi:hypothetical protein